MRRRSVIIGVFAGLLLAPEHASAQQPSAKIPRVGIITQAATDKNDLRFDAFRERLRDLGYVEGRNIILEFRFAGGDFSNCASVGGGATGSASRCYCARGPGRRQRVGTEGAHA